jgi:hypothetical protein
MTSNTTTELISGITYDKGWFTPATKYQYVSSGLGAFSLFTDFKKVFAVPLNVGLPSILTGLIIASLVLVTFAGLVLGCWVGDIVFPVTNPLLFTVETLVMGLGSAALMVALFHFTRSNPNHTPTIMEILPEFCVLAAKFGVLHLIFQFTGFYSWAFPETALGGALTQSWGSSCPDPVTYVRYDGLSSLPAVFWDTISNQKCHGVNNLRAEKAKGLYDKPMPVDGAKYVEKQTAALMGL